MQTVILYTTIFISALCLFVFYSNSISIDNSFMNNFKTLIFSSKIKDQIPLKPPIILEWNKYWEEIPYEKYECAKECIFTQNASFENEATLITFHYPNIFHTIFKLPKSKNVNRMNVFVSFESPGNYPYPQNLPDDFFNATISYKLDSDFPILYNCFKILTQNDPDKWEENEIDNILSNKTESIVTFVSNCPTSSKRELLIPILEKYIPITKYEKHFFVLALENSHCIDYVTEKIWRLKNLSVPIIMDRTLLRRELAYLNPYVIALSDFKTVKGFAEYLIYLMNNKLEYKRYFEWTKFYQKSDACGILPVLPCKICELALKVQRGFRKEINARQWWDNGTYEHDYVQTWLKSAFKNNNE